MESVIRITKTLRQQYLCFSLHELKAWGMNRKLYNYCILCLCCLLVAFYLVKTKCFIKMFLCCCNPCFKSLRIRPVKIGIGSAPDYQLVKKNQADLLSFVRICCKTFLVNYKVQEIPCPSQFYFDFPTWRRLPKHW